MKMKDSSLTPEQKKEMKELCFKSGMIIDDETDIKDILEQGKTDRAMAMRAGFNLDERRRAGGKKL